MSEESNININQLVQRLGTKLANYEIQIEVMQLEIERLKAENAKNLKEKIKK